MGNIVRLAGVRDLPKRAPKAVRSTTEAVILSKEGVAAWKDPPFQRPLRVNQKVAELAESMKCGGGILPGILTIGVFEGRKYLVDGQHRVEAFKISGLPEVYSEIRICHFDSMADMADEFVTLNSKLVAMRPDDILRGLETTSPGLMAIRKSCDFVGYDMIRRGPHTPVISMSVVLRCWFGAASDTPSSMSSSAAAIVKILTEDDAQKISQYLNIAHGAWGRDAEYHRLWGALNMILTMWLWRRIVLEQYSAKSTQLTAMQFGKCMMALSADSNYLDWLVGRMLGERDRSPCYARIRQIFIDRYNTETGKRITLPAPAWFQNRGAK